MDVIDMGECPGCKVWSMVGAECCGKKVLPVPPRCAGCPGIAEYGVLHPFMGTLNVCKNCLSKLGIGVEESNG